MTELPIDQRAYNQKLIEEFRAGGRRIADRPLLLLTTTGRKSGTPRTSPMMYIRIDDSMYVIASNAGAVFDPDWYRNLVAEPAVTVEAEGEEYAATARPVADEDRPVLWTRIVERYPFFIEHQGGVERKIPVVELIRA
ncbi:nitroreductase family deazaflavin-dependent oxidoreductase [Dactylosporangium sp. NPDC005555]|uniref:nitroreductase family deazaflavin-dependent oxidoreductase n=1 Tax=Dactylosporangium sp. NPDC005555 TaxID=3154889 RepID=UPI0033B119E4